MPQTDFGNLCFGNVVLDRSVCDWRVLTVVKIKGDYDSRVISVKCTSSSKSGQRGEDGRDNSVNCFIPFSRLQARPGFFQ